MRQRLLPKCPRLRLQKLKRARTPRNKVTRHCIGRNSIPASALGAAAATHRTPIAEKVTLSADTLFDFDKSLSPLRRRRGAKSTRAICRGRCKMVDCTAAVALWQTKEFRQGVPAPEPGSASGFRFTKADDDVSDSRRQTAGEALRNAGGAPRQPTLDDSGHDQVVSRFFDLNRVLGGDIPR